MGGMIVGFFVKHWLKALIVAAVVGMAGTIYASGYKAAWKKAERETLETKIASLERDIDAARIQLEAARVVARELEATDAENDERIRQLETALQNRPASDPRGLTQLELDSLLGLR